jgi:histidinol-phosphate aminotransferase
MEPLPFKSGKFLRMDLSESRLPPSPKVIEAIRSVAGRVNEYPDPSSLNLRKVLAEYNNVNPSNIIVGNGSDEIIDLISRAFLDKGDKIITFIPTFSQYAWSAEILGAHTVEIPSLSDREYVIRPEKLLDKISPTTKIIWICNPNNPTGNIIPQDCIKQILDSVGRSVIVAVDECYFEFSGQTSLNLLDKFENMIIVRSLSKTFCLAGLRVGYTISNTDIIKNIWKVKQPFNVNLIAQVAAVAALKDIEYYKDMWLKLAEERKYAIEKLREIEGVEILPSTTNFLLLNIGKCAKDPKKIYAKLVQKKISVLPGWSQEFSGLDEFFLRVLISTREDNDKFIEGFKNII